jgi:vacuolar-type H+-ATPase subunit I/STV1
MKNLSLYLFGALIMFPVLTMAQDKEVKRPDNIGVSDYDSFKNTSFDIKDESTTLKDNVMVIDKEVKEYAGIINTIGVDKLRNNLKALKESSDAVKKLNVRIGELKEQGQTLVEGAKNVKPRTKSPKAASNTKKSIKGLDLAKGDLSSIAGLLEEDIKLITDELKARGEPIE